MRMEASSRGKGTNISRGNLQTGAQFWRNAIGPPPQIPRRSWIFIFCPAARRMLHIGFVTDGTRACTSVLLSTPPRGSLHARPRSVSEELMQDMSSIVHHRTRPCCLDRDYIKETSFGTGFNGLDCILYCRATLSISVRSVCAYYTILVPELLWVDYNPRYLCCGAGRREGGKGAGCWTSPIFLQQEEFLAGSTAAIP